MLRDKLNAGPWQLRRHQAEMVQTIAAWITDNDEENMTFTTKTNCIAAAAAAAAATLVPIQGSAQQWPEKAVRVIVPFAPGGGTDIQARLLAKAFQGSMGQNFLVDNRTGASGLIGTQLAVDSPPDGSTILFVSGSISVVKTLMAKQMKFDIYKDLLPVSWISSTPLVLSVHPSVPAKTPRDLVAIAKRGGGGIMNAAGNSAGTTAHLAAEMFNQTFGVKSTILFYRGGGPAVIALISGEIDYVFATAPSVMPHLRNGRARALAVTTPKRSSALPEVPTMASFYPGFLAENWYAMFLPAGTPAAIASKLNSEIRKSLNDADIKAFYQREALEAIGSSPAELGKKLREDVDKYARVIQAGNIRAQ